MLEPLPALLPLSGDHLVRLHNASVAGKLAREVYEPVITRVLLSLTPTGRRLRNTVQDKIQHHEDELLNALSAPERATFLRVLQRLTDAALSAPES